MRIRDSIAERLEACGLYRRAASRWIEVMQRCLDDEDREWIRQSGLRVLCWFKQRRPAQAQRRRAIHIRRRTRGCAGWRHKCLILLTNGIGSTHDIRP